mgnify:CR=1 FL=1
MKITDKTNSSVSQEFIDGFRRGLHFAYDMMTNDSWVPDDLLLAYEILTIWKNRGEICIPYNRSFESELTTAVIDAK